MTFNSQVGTDTVGRLKGIHIAVSAAGCTAVIAGTSASTHGVVVTHYTAPNPLKIVATNSTLHMWNVAGCFGLINMGDSVTVLASYTIHPAQTITYTP